MKTEELKNIRKNELERLIDVDVFLHHKNRGVLLTIDGFIKKKAHEYQIGGYEFNLTKEEIGDIYKSVLLRRNYNVYEKINDEKELEKILGSLNLSINDILTQKQKHESFISRFSYKINKVEKNILKDDDILIVLEGHDEFNPPGEKNIYEKYKLSDFSLDQNNNILFKGDSWLKESHNNNEKKSLLGIDGYSIEYNYLENKFKVFHNDILFYEGQLRLNEFGNSIVFANDEGLFYIAPKENRISLLNKDITNFKGFYSSYNKISSYLKCEESNTCNNQNSNLYKRGMFIVKDDENIYLYREDILLEKFSKKDYNQINIFNEIDKDYIFAENKVSNDIINFQIIDYTNGKNVVFESKISSSVDSMFISENLKIFALNLNDGCLYIGSTEYNGRLHKHSSSYKFQKFIDDFYFQMNYNQLRKIDVLNEKNLSISRISSSEELKEHGFYYRNDTFLKKKTPSKKISMK